MTFTRPSARIGYKSAEEEQHYARNSNRSPRCGRGAGGAVLAEAGVEAVVIDCEERTTARSYACALHPRTLELLQRPGLAEAILEHGWRADTVAFCDREPHGGGAASI